MIMLRNCGSKNHILSFKSNDNDTINVAIEYSPLYCYMYEDTLGGFNYDLLRLIANKHNLKIKYHPIVTLQKSLDDLEKGKYNILVAQLPFTTDFEGKYIFTQSIYLDRQVLVQKKDNNGKPTVNSQLDLAKKTLYVVKGSPAEYRIINLSREIGDSIYIKHEDLYGPEQLIIMVAKGEIKYAVVNEKVAKEIAKSYPSIDISTDISFTQFQSWLLNPKESKLKNNLNLWINEAKKTPEYEALIKRYF